MTKLSGCGLAALLIYFEVPAQNVGIGTTQPTRKLSVAGSVVVDHNNANSGGLDSAALVFGTGGGSGITVKRTGPAPINGLSIWTGNNPRLNINAVGEIGLGGEPQASHRLRIYGDTYSTGHISTGSSLHAGTYAAIGGAVDPDFRLRIYAGNTRLGGDVNITGYTAIGGDVDPAYRLRVIGGHTRLGGDMHATGNAAIGGDVDNNFRFRVYDGNSRFGGNVQVTGLLSTTDLGAVNIDAANAEVTNLDVADLAVYNTLTIAGKGSVRSNGPSPLRIGFDQKTVDLPIGPGGAVAVEAAITDFTGGNDDVRVFVSQIVTNAGNTLFSFNMNVNVTEVDAGSDTCTLVIRNLANVGATLKATFYITTIAKN